MNRSLGVLTILLLLPLLAPQAAARSLIPLDVFDHEYSAWDQVLRRHVDTAGRVDYAGAEKDSALGVFLERRLVVDDQAPRVGVFEEVAKEALDDVRGRRVATIDIDSREHGLDGV